ncbi:hypothetical protein SEA_ATUIN_278 [Arthrobacter phage Atuin]|nr:hypothetical protein SEA_ATUIN_77 [Arthrobacter phage Atuin]
MSFNEGDIVKVSAVSADTMHLGLVGKTGTVLSVNDKSKTCRVDLVWDAPEGSQFDTLGALGTFNFTELELVKAIDQEEQIFKIAAALHTEGNYGDVPWAEIKADAERLYKVGIRHHG